MKKSTPPASKANPSMIGPAVLAAGAEIWAAAGAAEVAAGMNPVAMSQRPRRIRTVAASARNSRMPREYPDAGVATNALSRAVRPHSLKRKIGRARE